MCDFRQNCGVWAEEQIRSSYNTPDSEDRADDAGDATARVVRLQRKNAVLVAPVVRTRLDLSTPIPSSSGAPQPHPGTEISIYGNLDHAIKDTGTRCPPELPCESISHIFKGIGEDLSSQQQK